MWLSSSAAVVKQVSGLIRGMYSHKLALKDFGTSAAIIAAQSCVAWQCSREVEGSSRMVLLDGGAPVPLNSCFSCNGTILGSFQIGQ